MKVFQRDYSNFDKQALVTDIQSINWDVLLRDVYEPSSMFDGLNNKISEVIDTHIPIKQLSRQELKSRSKPWVTSGIRTSIRVENGLFKKFLKAKSTYYHARVKFYRNKLNHLTKLSNRSYYNNFFSIHVNNGKRIWQGIKEIVQINPQVNQSICKIVLENCEITDPKAKADAFDNYFANIGGNLASSIPGASKTANEFMPPPMCDSLFLCPVTAGEIQFEIAKLQTGKAVGPSSIPISILKILNSELAGPLQVIFNTSFLNGIVPDKFKLARVIPVFKKGSQTNLTGLFLF